MPVRKFYFLVRFTKSVLEETVLNYLASIERQVTFGLRITPSELTTLRDALMQRLMRGEFRVKEV